MKKATEKLLKLSAKMSKSLAVKSCGAASTFDTYQPKVPNAVRAMAEKNKTK
ncbi:MAG TPA: cyclic lactone autoinducer peptide [Ruminococcus sp.]